MSVAILRTRFTGSSPLARGPRDKFRDATGTFGLIPARAGTTRERLGTRPPKRAHPRSRGDHSSPLIRTDLPEGSSPLARGPHPRGRNSHGGTGLIPARAGTTEKIVKSGTATRAHPRSRGDHVSLEPHQSAEAGSSPLARGPPDYLVPGPDYRGLIPARAGTTLADMGFYPLHQQNRITLKPEPKSRIHDKQLLLTTTSTAILTRLTPP